MPKRKKPRGDLTKALDELTFEEEVEREFEEMPTTPRPRPKELDARGDPTTYQPPERRKCPQCNEEILQKGDGSLVKHEGPCGLACLGGGAGVGLPFHDQQCSHPKCRPLLIPLRGIPRKKRRR
jgi:hypothetical protein